MNDTQSNYIFLDFNQFVLSLLASFLKKEDKNALLLGAMHLLEESINDIEKDPFFSESDINAKHPLILLEKCFRQICHNFKELRKGLEILDSHKENIELKYYKYISNQSNYLGNLFSCKISFVEREQFDDIFDSCTLDEQTSQRTRILCLSINNEIPAMWGLYANSFNGFCFQYDLKEILSSVAASVEYKNVLILGNKVIYGNKPLLKSEICKILEKTINIKSYINKMLKCFSKHESWEFQKEYRFFAFSQNNYKSAFPYFVLQPEKYFYWDLVNKKIEHKEIK